MERYEVIKQIGTGSYGEIYLVRDKYDRSTWVLKQMGLQNEKARKSALTEANMLAELRHPNIVEYRHTFEMTTGHPAKRYLCVVMQFCEGGDLLQRLITQKGVHLPERVFFSPFNSLACTHSFRLSWSTSRKYY